MKIFVVYSSAPRHASEWAMELAAGSSVADALRACHRLQDFPDLAEPIIGVWGKQTSPGRVLSEGDRLEIYRGLNVDPKVARRERFKQQGAKGDKGAGLFAGKRSGAKAGY